MYIIALVTVTIWGVFSFAYTGVEDGSSGLSVLGWISYAFFMPGVILVYQLKGRFSNAEIPLAALTSWMIYSLLAIIVVHAVYSILKILKKKAKQRL